MFQKLINFFLRLSAVTLNHKPYMKTWLTLIVNINLNEKKLHCIRLAKYETKLKSLKIMRPK